MEINHWFISFLIHAHSPFTGIVAHWFTAVNVHSSVCLVLLAAVPARRPRPFRHRRGCRGFVCPVDGRIVNHCVTFEQVDLNLFQVNSSHNFDSSQSTSSNRIIPPFFSIFHVFTLKNLTIARKIKIRLFQNVTPAKPKKSRYCKEKIAVKKVFQKIYLH